MANWDGTHKPHIVADAILPRNKISTSVGYNPATIADIVTTSISGDLTSQLYKYMLDMVAVNCGMDRPEFMEFMEFLTNDPELRDRFTAHKTAKRLRGE